MEHKKQNFALTVHNLSCQLSLILLEIQSVWNNGGQKHSLSIDVRCTVSGQLFSLLYKIDELAAYIIRERFISYL